MDVSELQKALKVRDERIAALEKQVEQRDERIKELMSQLDKYQSVFAQSQRGPRKQRAIGISAEPQSQRAAAMKDQKDVKHRKHSKSHR